MTPERRHALVFSGTPDRHQAALGACDGAEFALGLVLSDTVARPDMLAASVSAWHGAVGAAVSVCLEAGDRNHVCALRMHASDLERLNELGRHPGRPQLYRCDRVAAARTYHPLFHPCLDAVSAERVLTLLGHHGRAEDREADGAPERIRYWLNQQSLDLASVETVHTGGVEIDDAGFGLTEALVADGIECAEVVNHRRSWGYLRGHCEGDEGLVERHRF
mmetsp:Transcript_28396/g.74593  ORF Transcript_28396/g.74593 Transcript_28396/m.74593 type:complete len:220 (-) Transcript_28396:86-745(-)